MVCDRTGDGATLGVMSQTALKSLPRTALEKKVNSLTNRIAKGNREASVMGERVAGAMGGGVAFATAVSVGFVEGRYRNNDGTPLSLGPVPLTLVAAAAGSAVALATGNRFAQSASDGAIGAYGYGLGLSQGAKNRGKKSRKVSGLGDEQMEDDIAEHYFGD